MEIPPQPSTDAPALVTGAGTVARLMPRLRDSRTVYALAGCVAFAGAFFAGTFLRAWFPQFIAVSYAALILTLSSTALIGLTAWVHHLRTWKRPLQQLQALVAEVHSGDQPVEALDEAPATFRPLASAIQAILRDLKKQRYEVSRIELEIMQRVAQRTSALESRYNSLQNQATRDSLTGVFNRRGFDHHLPEVFDEAQRTRDDLCLLMLDIDNFKHLNDSLGHASGDEMLRSIGQIVRSTMRPNDLAFRCGGDEFVIVLPGAGKAAGESLARRLVDLIDALGRQKKLQYPPGCSVGMASLSELQDPTLESLLKLADARLYDAKARRKSSRAPRTPATSMRKSA